MKCLFCIFLLILLKFAENKVTDKEYALMPQVFHLDNYEHCMLLGEEALYCYFNYEMTPLDSNNPPEVWRIIQDVNSNPFNYNHDKLRHGICVPIACPNVTKGKFKPDDPAIRDILNDCYDLKYAADGFKGKITEFSCSTTEPLFPVTNTDLTVAFAFISYILFVIFASFYEGLARYKPQEEYEKIISTKFGGIMATFSLCRSWDRLKTVKETPDVKAFRSIQGIRFYSLLLVVFLHSIMVAVSLPISNTRFAERIKDLPGVAFMNRDAYAMQSYFQISAWLLVYGIFTTYDGKKTLKLSDVISAFIYRYLRLTPLLVVVIIFHCTWLRHLTYGPAWKILYDIAIGNCQKNWWTNLIYLNNYIDPRYMCLPQTWTLSLDTQFFMLELLILYVVLKNKKLIWTILGTLLLLSACITFAVVYIMDLPEATYPYAEHLYNFGGVRSDSFIYSFIATWSNFPGPVTGFALGYLCYQYRNQQVFTKKIHIVLMWLITPALPLGAIIIPSMFIYEDDYVHSKLVSAIIMVLGRLFFAVGIGCHIFALTKGVGWASKWVCEWSPTYVLGRLGYSSYIVHVTVMFIRAINIWEVRHLSMYLIITDYVSDVVLTLIGGALLTLFIEMPLSEIFRMNKEHVSKKKDQIDTISQNTKEKAT